MTKKSGGNLQKVSQRPGEGHAVDMIITAVDGDSVTGAVELGSLPVPDRRYAAEAVGLRVNENQVRLFFGQSHPIGSTWLSLLVVNMSFESVKQFLSATPSTFKDVYSAYAEQVAPGRITEFTSNADQTVVVTASIVMAGYTGTNGCLDFYYASPFSMQQMAVFKKLAVEPVVRVNLPSSLVFAMLDGLTEAAKSFPKFNGGRKS